MTCRASALVLLAACALPAVARAAPATAAPREKMAVLVIGTSEADVELADGLTEVLISFVARRGGAEIAGKEEFRARLGVEDERKAQSCIGDVTCLGRAAVSLALKRIVAGTVGTRGKQFLFNLNLIDVESGKVDSRVFRLVEGGMDDLIKAVQEGAEELFRPRIEPGRIKVSSDPPGWRVSVDNAFIGVTPLISGTLLAGKHTVRVEADHRFPWTSKVEVLPEQDLGINVTSANLPERKRWPTYGAYGTATFSVLALGTGAFLGVLSQLSPSGTTRADAQSDFEQKRLLGATANVFFLGGVLSAGASVYLFKKYNDHIFGRE